MYYYCMSDPELDDIVRQAQREHPGIGLRPLRGGSKI